MPAWAALMPRKAVLRMGNELMGGTPYSTVSKRRATSDRSVVAPVAS
ncbi:Uncharacterised protein [Mycobacteroides abscessus]|nr:Uncharacterised protein [Mycobacteroides abscessus]